MAAESKEANRSTEEVYFKRKGCSCFCTHEVSFSLPYSVLFVCHTAYPSFLLFRLIFYFFRARLYTGNVSQVWCQELCPRFCFGVRIALMPFSDGPLLVPDAVGSLSTSMSVRAGCCILSLFIPVLLFAHFLSLCLRCPFPCSIPSIFFCFSDCFWAPSIPLALLRVRFCLSKLWSTRRIL